MEWLLGETTEPIYEFLPPWETEYVTNGDGVRVIVFGRRHQARQTIFIYEYDDIRMQFWAWRSSKNWINDEPQGKHDWSNYALGPSCDVWLDTRNLKRQLSTDEISIIKHNITEFLTKEFRRCRTAIAPHAETVSFY